MPKAGTAWFEIVNIGGKEHLKLQEGTAHVQCPYTQRDEAWYKQWTAMFSDARKALFTGDRDTSPETSDLFGHRLPQIIQAAGLVFNYPSFASIERVCPELMKPGESIKNQTDQTLIKKRHKACVRSRNKTRENALKAF